MAGPQCSERACRWCRGSDTKRAAGCANRLRLAARLFPIPITVRVAAWSGACICEPAAVAAEPPQRRGAALLAGCRNMQKGHEGQKKKESGEEAH